MLRKSPAPSALTLLGSSVRRQIVDILANLPVTPTADEPQGRRQGLTAAQLGDRLGLHLTTIRFHVDQLVDGDLLRAHDLRNGVGRPRRHYAINPGSLGDVTHCDGYRLLADLLADTLGSHQDGVALTAEDAALRWVNQHAARSVPPELPREPARTPGAFLAKLGMLIDLLEHWGYSPTIQTTEGGRAAEVVIADCPLRDLAERNPAVVCGIHRGLLRATLDLVGETETEIGLRISTGEEPCVARITSHAPFGARAGEQSGNAG